jgi:hypothetical protein
VYRELKFWTENIASIFRTEEEKSRKKPANGKLRSRRKKKMVNQKLQI